MINSFTFDNSSDSEISISKSSPEYLLPNPRSDFTFKLKGLFSGISEMTASSQEY